MELPGMQVKSKSFCRMYLRYCWIIIKGKLNDQTVKPVFGHRGF